MQRAAGHVLRRLLRPKGACCRAGLCQLATRVRLALPPNATAATAAIVVLKLSLNFSPQPPPPSPPPPSPSPPPAAAAAARAIASSVHRRRRRRLAAAARAVAAASSSPSRRHPSHRRLLPIRRGRCPHPKPPPPPPSPPPPPPPPTPSPPPSSSTPSPPPPPPPCRNRRDRLHHLWLAIRLSDAPNIAPYDCHGSQRAVTAVVIHGRVGQCGGDDYAPRLDDGPLDQHPSERRPCVHGLLQSALAAKWRDDQRIGQTTIGEIARLAAVATTFVPRPDIVTSRLRHCRTRGRRAAAAWACMSLQVRQLSKRTPWLLLIWLPSAAAVPPSSWGSSSR